MYIYISVIDRHKTACVLIYAYTAYVTHSHPHSLASSISHGVPPLFFHTHVTVQTSTLHTSTFGTGGVTTIRLTAGTWHPASPPTSLHVTQFSVPKCCPAYITLTNIPSTSMSCVSRFPVQLCIYRYIYIYMYVYIYLFIYTVTVCMHLYMEICVYDYDNDS